MSFAALIVAAVACTCFAIEAVKERSVIALGLAVFVIAYCLTFIVQGAPSWVIH